MSFARGPFLRCVLLCERVMVEQDGVKSAIRIIDRVIRRPLHNDPNAPMTPFNYHLVLLTSMTAGDIRGTHTVKIQPRKPSGEILRPATVTVYLEGEEDHGADIVTDLQISLDQTGIYWFDVYFDDEPLSRVPLRVVYVPQVIPRHSTDDNQPPEAAGTNE